MTNTFDWAGLWQGAEAAKHDCMFCDCDAPNEAAAAYLRTRIEAAFVPVDEYISKLADASKLYNELVQATARAEAAEAENARLLRVIDAYLSATASNSDKRQIVTTALGDEHGK